jgi:hypothetical protein
VRPLLSPRHRAHDVKRIIKLKSIKDPHVVEFVDAGVTKEGEPTSQRQALTRYLQKRIAVDGKQMPVFLVEHVGEWKMAPGEVLPTGDEFVSYDEDTIRREHPEHMLAAWRKARDGFIAKSVEARRAAEVQMEQQMGGEVAKSIQAMVKSVASSTKGAARV